MACRTFNIATGFVATIIRKPTDELLGRSENVIGSPSAYTAIIHIKTPPQTNLKDINEGQKTYRCIIINHTQSLCD
jgi:hypothetical protein